MTDDDVKKYIELTVQRTIRECKRSGLLKQSDAALYADASAIISSYFRTGKTDASITYAIQGQRFDPYYRIISLYFEDGCTVEKIAEKLGVDVSTIVRNKKRLCLAIYNDII